MVALLVLSLLVVELVSGSPAGVVRLPLEDQEPPTGGDDSLAARHPPDVWSPYCPFNGRFGHPLCCEMVWVCSGIDTANPRAALLFCPLRCDIPWFDTRCHVIDYVIHGSSLYDPNVGQPGLHEWNTQGEIGDR